MKEKPILNNNKYCNKICPYIHIIECIDQTKAYCFHNDPETLEINQNNEIIAICNKEEND
jgi:hypothetical protein